MKPQNKNENSIVGRNICVVPSLLQSLKLLKCTMGEADVHYGPRLQEMYRPGHMEVDGGIQLVSTGPQRPYSSTQDEDWGVACPPAP